MSTTGPTTEPGQPPPEATTTGPRTTREELRDLGRIRRTTKPHRKVAGVAGGLARHLDVDPIILRVAFVVLVFFGGSGLLLYGAAWLLLPEDGAVRAPLGLDARSRSIALVVVGAISVLLLLGDSIGQFDFPWPLVLVALLALAVLVYLDRDRDRGAGSATLTGDPSPAYDPLPPLPRNPRKGGPILFWFTLLASAVLVAGLGVLDLAGVPVADAAYPAVVVATCGVMLLIGAFWGRAGGLILVGLVAAVSMAIAAASGTVEGSDISRTPTTADSVPDRLSTGGGEIVLDLTEVADVDALDGRTLTQRVRAGRIEVIVPDGVRVEAHADVAVGHIQLFEDDRGGFDLSNGSTIGGPPGAPTIVIDAHAFVGEIQIHFESQELIS